jgi:uncharacterized protein (TIGR02145 family)
MKTKTLLFIAMVWIMSGAFAQKPSMNLTFTAYNNGQHVPLNSILIENLTQGGDTTLYAPDTVLVLDYVAGTGEIETTRNDGLFVSQNFPNPMEGKTNVNLYLPVNGNLQVTISDIRGSEIIKWENLLSQGNHSFVFFPGRESIYFFTALAHHKSQSIKMINTPSQTYAAEACRLEYKREADGTVAFKSGMSLNNFVFNPGDQLKFTTSTALGDIFMIDAPSGNQTYIFQYGVDGTPCPDMPTLTDIDGNLYNTVKIGDQCWMRENLNTTAYKNGTPIPNVTAANEWENLITGAYVRYDNVTFWEDSYGALYNWYATVDPNGLCPTGWHVPTDEEYTVLKNHLGSANEAGGKMKSTRTEPDPHPRWDSPNKGATNESNWSGLPGGGREDDGDFDDIGEDGYWWSSTEDSTDDAWFRGMEHNKSELGRDESSKADGFSVRCLRD